MIARRRSEPIAPTLRTGGPPGIDWTQAAPECPACWRTWVAGDLPSNALLSRRTHAALAAATLAFSSAAPTVVLAASQPHHRSHARLNDTDPGDAGVSLPVGDSPPAPGAAEPEPPETDPEGPDQGTSPAPEPVADQPGPDAPSDSGSEAQPSPPENEAPAPPTTEAPPSDEAAPVPSPPPPSATTTGPPETAAVQPLRTQRHVMIKGASTRSHRSSARRLPLTASPPTSRATVRTVAVGIAVGVSRARIHPRDRVHVVRPGESLWSIASALLREDASNDRVAAEVNRLWALNREGIGTNDPDLLPIGTRLTLR
jgi:hypothetical protein